MSSNNNNRSSNNNIVDDDHVNVNVDDDDINESMRSLSLDYLNLLINGQAFSDVAFSIDGRLIHAHRCILAARSLFFRKFFCSPSSGSPPDHNSSSSSSSSSSPSPGINIDNITSHRIVGSPRGSSSTCTPQQQQHQQPQQLLIIPVNSVGYEVFLLLLQFLYSGQVSMVPQKHESRPNCGDRGCWHTHCSSAVNLALETLSAARSFGVQHLALLTQKQLGSMVEKASIEDVMKVLMASRKQNMHQLWNTCSHLVAKSGLPPEILAKHIPIDIVAKIEDLRMTLTSHVIPNLLSHSGDHHHHHHHDINHNIKIRRMRRALDSSDVELVKLMVMGEGLNLDEALALHYAVENCSREVVKALLELGAADVNHRAGPAGKTPLHVAAEMVSPDMVAVLLDHHADPNVQTVDGVSSLDVLRTLTSDFLFKGAVPGLTHIEPNKLRLCLELVQSAAMVISREEGNIAVAAAAAATAIYPAPTQSDSNLDSRLVYLNLAAAQHDQDNVGYNHHHHHHHQNDHDHPQY